MDRNELICQEAQYLLDHRATVRQASAHFGRSKTMIHADMRDKLPRISPSLAAQVNALLDFNRAERAIRGGLATQAKYRAKTFLEDLRLEQMEQM